MGTIYEFRQRPKPDNSNNASGGLSPDDPRNGINYAAQFKQCLNPDDLEVLTQAMGMTTVDGQPEPEQQQTPEQQRQKQQPPINLAEKRKIRRP